jgi:hypothetical protein
MPSATNQINGAQDAFEFGIVVRLPDAMHAGNSNVSAAGSMLNSLLHDRLQMMDVKPEKRSRNGLRWRQQSLFVVRSTSARSNQKAQCKCEKREPNEQETRPPH